MLVAVLMVFVVFSFTGVAMLNVSYLSVHSAMETSQNIRNQFAMESTLNKALWRINTGADSLATFNDGATQSVYDTTNNVLTINVDQFDMEQEVMIDLSEDTHFNRSIAVSETLVENGNAVTADEDHRSREFDFLPTVDLQYFTNHAVAIHNESWHRWDTEDLTQEGIHIFSGNLLRLDNINLNNSTLVFTGRYIFFTGENTINAPVPADSADAMPALIFTNPHVTFIVAEGGWVWGHHYESTGDHIEGAIYCAGNLILRNGELSGPVIGRVIALDDDFDFLDDEHNEYYRWNKGFGRRDSYDWPKQIHRWRSHSWHHRAES